MFTIGRNFHVIHMTDDMAALDAWYDDVFSVNRWITDNYNPDLHRFASLFGIGDLCIESMQPAFADDGANFRVSADSLRLTVAKELKHDPTCGGKQWFHPFSTVDDAAMGTTAENAFSGASLGTKWSDPNKRSGFFGTFSY